MAKCMAIGYEFLPFSFSSLGELEADAVKQVRKFSMAQDIGARAAVHIFNMISFAIAKGVGAQIISRLPSNLLLEINLLMQGDPLDPLAPYLFILVMESFHLSFSRVVDAGIFKGIKIDNSTMISHLFYADDAVFVGEWSDDNLSSIMHVLLCFSLALGPKINVKRSHFLGVGIHDLIVAAAASTLGCSIIKTPFKYLGVTVGGCLKACLKFDKCDMETIRRNGKEFL
ncbi:RNA-directed DNA polymerase, eukaryota [Tanacetum coccineum]